MKQSKFEAAVMVGLSRHQEVQLHQASGPEGQDANTASKRNASASEYLAVGTPTRIPAMPNRRAVYFQNRHGVNGIEVVFSPGDRIGLHVPAGGDLSLNVGPEIQLFILSPDGDQDTAGEGTRVAQFA